MWDLSLFASSFTSARLHAGQVIARARVHPYLFTLFDKEWHLNRDAGLQGGRFCASRCRVALMPRFGVGNLELDGGRQFHADGLSLVHLQLDDHVLFHVLQSVTQLIPREGELVVRGRIHKHVFVAAGIEVLHLTGLDVSPLDALTGAECPFLYLARADVLQFRTYRSSTLARFDVEEFDDGPDAVLQLDGESRTQIVY